MIKEMHYMFKLKLNKVDSQNFRNLLVPEIDLFLNEAQTIFVKTIAEPRFRTQLGFETNHRTIEDIRPLVITDANVTLTNDVVQLPTDYFYYTKSKCKINSGNCIGLDAKINIRQHDDDFENNPFYESSLEWREVNGVFNKDGIKLYPKNFTINNVKLSYIKKPIFIHDAQSFGAGGYNSLSQGALTGFVNSELPVDTHSEIVDIAVMIATGALQIPDMQNKIEKLKLNQLIN